ncbi:MAG: hypothetical protein U9Q04_08330 [Campylobacterota bacterium]|nr:hypothetical protein [Campylobacterota bacterium]
MKLEENVLILEDKLEYENYEELLKLSKDCDEIVVTSNDIHPSIMQILFCLSTEKQITVEDEFNEKFFENLKLAV